MLKPNLLTGLVAACLLVLAACQPNEKPSAQGASWEPFVLDESTDSLYTAQDEKMVVYQIFTRLFGNLGTANVPHGTAQQNGVGKFNDINEAALKSLKNMGITHVWYTGVLEHALMADYTAYGIALDDADVVKGRAGSPYAIKDYYDVNPDLAVDPAKRLAEFEALMDRSHQAGLKVLIDFVPNHVARQYISDQQPANTRAIGQDDDTTQAFAINNNFYYLPGQRFNVPQGYEALGPKGTHPTKNGQFNETPAKATGNNVFSAQPNVGDWFETVKLNYGYDPATDSLYTDPIPNTWVKMRDILLHWAAFGVDGFRCDMAEMVPVAFWGWAIPQVKEQYPNITFIAEIYNPAAYGNYLEQAQFDYLYDKVQLYDTLRHIITDRGLTQNLTGVWQDLKGQNHRMLRFLENHDEQRIASPQFAGSARKAWPAMVLSATHYTGPVMVYFGQEVGEPGAGAEGFQDNDGRTTIFDYWGVPEHQKWVNNHAYDGGLLSGEQKALRQDYARLLNLAQTNPAITQGRFFDLHGWQRVHMPNNSGQYNNETYAYARYNGTQTLVGLLNFSSTEQEVVYHLPKTLAQNMPLQASGNTWEDLLGSAGRMQVAAQDSTIMIKATLPPNGAALMAPIKQN